MIGFVVTSLSMTAVLVPLVISVTLIYRVGGVVNFGGGYVAVFAAAACAAWGASNGLAGVLLTLTAGAAVGALTYLIAVRPAQRRGVATIGLTLTTLGIGLLLNFVTREVFGGEPTVIQPWLPGTIEIFGYQTATQRLLIIGLALVLVVALYLLFDRTLVGKSMAAVSFDQSLAEMYGIRGTRFQLVAWVVAGVCLAIGGIFQATVASVSVEMAPMLLVFSLVGAVTGGLGSLPGAIGGALIAGTVMTLTDQFISPGYQLTALLVVLSLVLLFRPSGLFSFHGKTERV